MNKNKYLLMVSSIGVFVLLATAAISENFLAEWHSIQYTAKTEEGPLDVRLRQIEDLALAVTAMMFQRLIAVRGAKRSHI